MTARRTAQRQEPGGQLFLDRLLADGAIVATTDGGATWTAQSPGTAAHLTDVAFSDATHGWAVGEGGTILVTTSGGE